MNGFKIIENIIADGINQCNTPVWDRLLISNFDIPYPDNKIFKTPEEYLELQLKELANNNPFYEIEYYTSRPLMTEVEYSETEFPLILKKAPELFESKRMAA